MPPQDHVNSEDNDGWHQNSGYRLQDNIIFRFVDTVVFFCVFLTAFTLLFIYTQQNQHRTGSNKQHVGLSQRIKCPVIQDHTGNDIDCSRFLQPILDVALGHFVVYGIGYFTDGRQVRYHSQQHQHQGDTEYNTKDPIQFPKCTDLRIVFHIVDMFIQALSFALALLNDSLIFFKFRLRLHFYGI